ncbi:hypothetical protein H310_02183 [Aphanomyces invadans]|uniref:Uncharacterized protein n=1 Tax=Aphanomyces invadans TaxID=157072 RepID=A0A024UNH4_9STRA|nr:hypothetical protein H310_02183 [Aphanomyces invadans]ETW07740.1 hypothetical protein H310_02183 [Aphanomyces invadans]|eukprot:XP_008863833.1 hypothetical protein H310_02183 [Aphanomyces invadans]
MDDFYGGIDVPGSFLLTLERFSNLRRLELKCTTALTEFELDLLFASLSSCPIESLHFKQSPWELPPSCAARLGHWLLHSNRATELSLDACSVHRHDCANVVFAIASSPTLKHLRIVRGNLGRALSSAAHLPHRLHTLVLLNTHLTPTSMMHKIMWLSHLVELHLDGNPVRDRGVRRLVKALLASSRTGDIPLKVLGLANAGIGADGGADLASVLPLTYLTSLSVGRNAMGDSVGLTLAAVLPRCRHLSHLDVHRLALTDDGVVAIVSALPMCQSLEFVNLSENWTTFVGAVQLVTVLPQCAHVKFLSLAHNPLEARGVQALMRVLPSHMRLNLTVDMEAADCRQCVELATTLGVADRVTLSTSAAGWRSSTATVGGSQLCVIGPT